MAVRAATGTIPIVWIGVDPVQTGFAASLARPGGNITGVTVDAGIEISGKRLQILKEAVPSASKVAFWTCARPGKVATGNSARKSFGRRADYWKSR